MRIRDDKNPEDATSAEQIVDMFESQSCWKKTKRSKIDFQGEFYPKSIKFGPKSLFTMKNSIMSNLGIQASGKGGGMDDFDFWATISLFSDFWLFFIKF